VQRNIVGEVGRAVKALWYLAVLRPPHRFPSPRLIPMPVANAPPPRAKRDSAASAPGRRAAERAGPTFSISVLAQEFALTTRAIRFYEDEGLLTPLRRGQTRVYGERERTRIKLILRGKRLGLSLSEIRELFDLYAATGSERTQLAKFLPMLADRRAMLLQQREDIDAVLAEIAVLERDCRRRLAPDSALPARAARPAGARKQHGGQG
jgi:DNA-binding transcriptional MerR regulator